MIKTTTPISAFQLHMLKKKYKEAANILEENPDFLDQPGLFKTTLQIAKSKETDTLQKISELFLQRCWIDKDHAIKYLLVWNQSLLENAHFISSENIINDIKFIQSKSNTYTGKEIAMMLNAQKFTYGLWHKQADLERSRIDIIWNKK